jgi:rubrerythrin
MDSTTRANLNFALRGEALAMLQYWLFERQARAEGKDELAELFEQIGKEERREHAREVGTLLGIPGSTRENLRSAIAGEVDEHRRLYPHFAAKARQAGDLEAARRFQELGADEHRHADALRRELERLEIAARTAVVVAPDGAVAIGRDMSQ